jgi:hypothetical protein
MPLIVGHHNEPSEALIKRPPVLLEADLVGHDLTFRRAGPKRFAPENLENLTVERVRWGQNSEDALLLLTSPGLNLAECSTT